MPMEIHKFGSQTRARAGEKRKHASRRFLGPAGAGPRGLPSAGAGGALPPLAWEPPGPPTQASGSAWTT